MVEYRFHIECQHERLNAPETLLRKIVDTTRIGASTISKTLTVSRHNSIHAYQYDGKASAIRRGEMGGIKSSPDVDDSRDRRWNLDEIAPAICV